MDSPSPPVPNINPQLPTSSHSASHDDKEIHSVGSFENDHQAGGYTLCCGNIQEFERWKLKEEERNIVEIIKKQHFKPTALTAKLWTTKQIYICARGHSGGRSKYQKKHDQERSIPSKKVGCSCRLTLKTYPNTSKILGLYVDRHTHETGNKNMCFTRLRKETRDEIERLLRL